MITKRDKCNGDIAATDSYRYFSIPRNFQDQNDEGVRPPTSCQRVYGTAQAIAMSDSAEVPAFDCKHYVRTAPPFHHAITHNRNTR